MTPFFDVFFMILTVWGLITLLCIHFSRDEGWEVSIRALIIGFLAAILLVCWIIPIPMD